MKLYMLFLFAAISLQSLIAQNDIAALGDAPFHYAPSESDNTAAAEPLVSVAENTVNDKAFVRFGKGLYRDVTLQVLTPTSEVLVNREIPSGSARVQIDLDGFPDGVYTVRVKMGDKTWVKQVSKG